MAVTSKDEQRRARLQEFNTLIEGAGTAVSALVLIVQGREARAAPGDPPLEVAFAETGEGSDKPGLPAGLWVALRRGDVEMALELLARASDIDFVIGEREEMGTGYRLETVEEKRPLPDVELLEERLASVVDIPRDVVAVLAEWGGHDPRTRAEVGALLDGRFGAPPTGAEQGAPPTGAEQGAPPTGAEQGAPPTGAEQGAPSTGVDTLSMSVSELADVLQLSPAQSKVLATLARRARLAVTPSQSYPPDPAQPGARGSTPAPTRRTHTAR